MNNVSIDAHSYVGGVIGLNHGTIKSCGLFGTGSTIDAFSKAGGIVGRNDGGVIQSCGISDTTIVAVGYVGGICGYSDNGDIYDCYSLADVSDNDYVGGIVGKLNSGDIARCLSAGLVTGDLGNGFVGPLWGALQGGFPSDNF